MTQPDFSDVNDRKLFENVEGILSDLVNQHASEKDLLIAARAMRLAKSMNIYDVSLERFALILGGDNPYGMDFFQKLEELK